MADTTYLRYTVEPWLRGQLEKEFGQPFASKVLTLTTGGTHEFDAVSQDNQVVAAIKTASGRTATGRNPSGKIKDSIAELYFLSLVEAPNRLLILTSPEFHGILCSALQGRWALGVAPRLMTLPEHIQRKVNEVQKRASDEITVRRKA